MSGLIRRAQSARLLAPHFLRSSAPAPARRPHLPRERAPRTGRCGDAPPSAGKPPRLSSEKETEQEESAPELFLLLNSHIKNQCHFQRSNTNKKSARRDQNPCRDCNRRCGRDLSSAPTRSPFRSPSPPRPRRNGTRAQIAQTRTQCRCAAAFMDSVNATANLGGGTERRDRVRADPITTPKLRQRGRERQGGERGRTCNPPSSPLVTGH